MVSEEFWAAIIGASTDLSVDCERCGRVHFGSYEPTHHDEGELDRLLAKSKEDPDKYIEHINTAVGYGYFEGKQIVYKCPCSTDISRHENFIWSHRYIIADYLAARAKRELEDKKMQVELIGGIGEMLFSKVEDEPAPQAT